MTFQRFCQHALFLKHASLASMKACQMQRGCVGWNFWNFNISAESTRQLKKISIFVFNVLNRKVFGVKAKASLVGVFPSNTMILRMRQ